MSILLFHYSLFKLWMLTGQTINYLGFGEAWRVSCTRSALAAALMFHSTEEAHDYGWDFIKHSPWIFKVFTEIQRRSNGTFSAPLLLKSHEHIFRNKISLFDRKLGGSGLLCSFHQVEGAELFIFSHLAQKRWGTARISERRLKATHQDVQAQ